MEALGPISNNGFDFDFFGLRPIKAGVIQATITTMNLLMDHSINITQQHCLLKTPHHHRLEHERCLLDAEDPPLRDD